MSAWPSALACEDRTALSTGELGLNGSQASDAVRIALNVYTSSQETRGPIPLTDGLKNCHRMGRA